MSTPSNSRKRAVDSLVAIAIAALDQAVPLAGTVGAAVLQNTLRAEPRRTGIGALDEIVVRQVRIWAAREGLQDDLEAGLHLAEQVMREHGATATMIAEANYVADAVSSMVIHQARADRMWDQQVQRWGRDNSHVIAERAICVVYDTIIADLQVSVPVVPGLASLGGRVDEATRLIRRLQPAQAATRDQVIDYLTSRLVDWDRPVWGPQVPITMRRRLDLRPPGSRAGGGQVREVSDVDALGTHDMLVVLGDPGAGKTWLARWYARQAARRALDRLGTGSPLDDVEIPLFVTWDEWSRSSGGVRESLVDAAFATGSGHSAMPDDVTIKQFLLDPSTQVLLIVESLDEAAGRQGQANRLHELSSLVPAWRVIVTSRPAAWERTASTFPDHHRLGIADLRDLSYPADVDEFVGTWFESEPGKATALLRQIRARPELARTASSPLMLTIYCLLIEHDVEAGLPTRRHQLYDALIRQLLERRDKNRGMNEPVRYEERVRTLSRWAWQAVGSSSDPHTGLGNWADTFITTEEPAPVDVIPLDEIAPRISTGGFVGLPVRRFVHRTILEHFVAQHISTLDADQAVQILLPHLWFDPDWQVAAPAAVAAHNRIHSGELFDRLLKALPRLTDDPIEYTRASRELDNFLLAVAEESDPSEWGADHQAVFHECRIRNATVSPHKMARTAHWTASNAPVIERVANRIATRTYEKLYSTTRDWDGPMWENGFVHFDGRDLPNLASTPEDQALLRNLIMNKIDSAPDRGQLELLIAMVGLQPLSDADRPTLFKVLVGLENDSYGRYANDLATFIEEAPEGLRLIARSEEERARIADRLLEDLGGVDYGLHIVHGMQLLDRPEGDLDYVRGEFVSEICAWGGMARNLAEAAHQIGLSAAQHRLVAEALLRSMDGTDWHVTEHAAWHARSLARIAAAPEHSERARSILLRLLPENTRAWKVRQVVKALIAHRPTDADRRVAKSHLLVAIGDHHEVGDEALEAFEMLRPDHAEAEQARRQVMHVLRVTDPERTGRAVGWLAALDPLEEERSEARTIVLDRLHQDLAPNIKALLSLRPTAEELRQARETIMAFMKEEGDAYWIIRAATVLPRLDPTPDQLRLAREHLWRVADAYSPQGDLRLDDYIAALLALDPTVEERERAKDLVYECMTGPNDPRNTALLRRTSTGQWWLSWVNGG